ncbi:hypothetical protein SAMN05444392_11229 [Seinonella peptonophila]|uniref:Uncharacterized protein n=1 Tax=Seinonella peptonophila TaxID=112248 RepID=A0A1M5A5Q0_9BACL|nr:hypothetical protein SAMN05444392_11229 [Seinonella peptonophila]
MRKLAIHKLASFDRNLGEKPLYRERKATISNLKRQPYFLLPVFVLYVDIL